MSRGEYEATQSLGWLSKVGIGALLLFAFWLMGHDGDKPSNTPDNPRPSHSTSAPESVDHG